MRELALFAGAGGGLLGSILLGWRTVCAIEIDPYRRKVLAQRIADGVFEPFEIHDDVRTFDGTTWRGKVDIVSGGFPCQPFSLAGRRQGESDDRNGWPHMARIIREVRPSYVFAENVPGLLSSGYFGRVLGDLAALGFDAEWGVLGAHDVGAPHRRERLWILAYDTQHGRRPWRTKRFDPSGQEQSEQPLQALADADQGRREVERSSGLLDEERQAFRDDIDGRDGQDVGNATQFGRNQTRDIDECSWREFARASRRSSWWARDPADEGNGAESFVGRVAHELAHRFILARAIAERKRR